MMDNYKRYTDLEVWNESRKLVTNVYTATKAFPKDELFGLTNQIRRCAVSIPSNIAEGCGRNYTKDSIQFFYIARGSLYELETQLYVSCDLSYIEEATKQDLLRHLEVVRKLLSGFIKYYSSLTKQVPDNK